MTQSHIPDRNWGTKNSHFDGRESWLRVTLGGLNFFRSIVTFSRGRRPEFA
jgi:hypothetical protein